MITVRQYKEKLLTSLYELYQNNQFCDLTLKLKDGEVRVHRLILCASSGYFKTLLSAECESGMVCLSDINLKEMEAVLRFVYTGEINPNKTDLRSGLFEKFGLIDKKLSPEEGLAIIAVNSTSSLKPQTEMRRLVEPDQAEKLKSNSLSVPGRFDESQILSSTSADKVYTEGNCNQNCELDGDCLYSLQDHFVPCPRVLINKQKPDPSLVRDENVPVSKSYHNNCSSESVSRCDSCGSPGVDNEQTSCSEGVVKKCKDSDLHSKKDNRGDINERRTSRDIVQEAYMAAMDMDLTDTDGGTSADNCEQNSEDRQVRYAGNNEINTDHVRIIVKTTQTSDVSKEPDVTGDMTTNLSLESSGSSATRTAGELSGALVPSDTDEKKMDTEETENVCELNSTEIMSGGCDMSDCQLNTEDEVKCHDSKNTNNQIGVVSGLRSRNGKRPRKVYTDSVSEEVLSDQQTSKTCKMKCPKYKKINNDDNINDTKNDVETITDLNNTTNAGTTSENIKCPEDKKEQSSSVNVVKTVKKGQHMWYCCPECGRTFKSLKLVAGHRHSKHNVAFDPSEFEVHKCKDCAYETLEVHRLACHRTTSHSTTRPYVCEWCGKDFKLLGALTLHTNTHTKARKFECPHCDKVFTQHGARKRHIEEKHEKSSRHLCDVCPYSALDRVKLVQHKYINHSALLPPEYTIYRCTEDGCKFETFRKQLYTGHMNTHNGVQEYACDVCQKKFSSAGNMRSHKTVHKDKSLSCSYAGCDFTTRVNNRLAQHVRLMHTHRDMKPHVCPHCPYKTAIKGNLLKHKRNIHRAFQNRSTVDNSVQKGDNPIQGDNSSMQIPVESSTSLLRSLLYSSGSVQFVDVTKQHLSDTREIIVNGIAPEVILGGVTQMVLGVE